MEKQNSASNMIQSVERALDILELLSGKTEPMSAIEISASLSINRTTTYGLLNTLLQKKYVVKNNSGSKYSVSPKLFELGINYPRKLPLALYAAPYMTDMLYRHDVSVYLSIHYETGKAMIITAKSPARSAGVILGKNIPMHASASGKVMLAFLSPDKLEEVVDSLVLYKHTLHTIIKKEDLLAELQLIRDQGYATSFGEQFDNTACLAFPVLDHTDQVIASLSFSDNTDVIHSKQLELIRDGLQASKYLSMDLGWDPSAKDDNGSRI